MASVPAVRPRLSGKARPVIGSAWGWPEFELVHRFCLSGENLQFGGMVHVSTIVWWLICVGK